MIRKKVVYIRDSEIYNDSRASKEIKALLTKDYHVIVIGWNKNGQAYEKCRDFFPNAKIEYYFHPVRVEGELGMRGIIKLFGFMMFVWKKLIKCRKNIEIIHACDFNAAFIANIYCRYSRKPLIYDIYDYYVDSHFLPSILSKIVERLDVAIINRAEATIICTEERKEQIQKAKPKKLIVMHNSPEVIESYHTDGCIYDYAYCGSISDMRLLQEIIEAYSSNADIKMCFAGYGKYENQVKTLASQYENVDYLGALPYNKVLEVEADARCISAIYEPVIRNHRLCAPNKFYEALALGKPVIVCENTGIDKLVVKENIGLVIEYNAGAFYNAIRQIKDHPDESKAMGERAREIYLSKYRWSIMADRMLHLYDEILKSR